MIPDEFKTSDWHDLAVRLGHKHAEDMLSDDRDFSIRMTGQRWRVEWRRYYDGVPGDTLTIEAGSLYMVPRLILAVEDDNDREAGRGDDHDRQ